MKQNQKSHATKYDRYPEIFSEISLIVPKPKSILSFGCSSGMECNTFEEIYFSGAKIVGLDINEEIIKKNNKKK